MAILQNSNGNGQSYSKKVTKPPYVMLVGSDEEMVLILKRILEMESGEHPTNDSSLDESGVDKKVLRLLHKLSPMSENAATHITPLGHRQTEILKYVAKGRPNKVIAYTLGISEHTVKNQLRSINEKLKAKDRTQAVVLAMRNGWLNGE